MNHSSDVKENCRSISNLMRCYVYPRTVYVTQLHTMGDDSTKTVVVTVVLAAFDSVTLGSVESFSYGARYIFVFIYTGIYIYIYIRSKP